MNRIIDLKKLKEICVGRHAGDGLTLWVHPRGEPVRDVFKPSALVRTTAAPCHKEGRHLHVEYDRNEPSAIQLFDIDPDVVRVLEQPEVLEVAREGLRPLHVIPDFLVARADGSYRRYEVKSAVSFVRNPSLTAELKQKQAFYRAAGLDYRVLVVNTIDRRIFWTNVAIVACKRDLEPHPEDVQRVRRHLAEARDLASTLGACADQIQHDDVNRFDPVLAMMHKRHLRIDLEKPLGRTSRVELVLS